MSTHNKLSNGIRSKAAALTSFVLLAAAAAPASAVVVTVSNVNKSVTWAHTSTFLHESFNVAGFSVQFGFSGNAGNSENPYILGNNSLGILRVPFSYAPAKQSVGTPVEATQGLYTQVSAAPFEGSGSQWVSSTAGVVDGYVSFFVAVSTGVHYAYAHFRYDDPNNTITLLDYAYEDQRRTGLTISSPLPAVANPVPEPSTYALMALGLGAVGFTARRRPRG